MEAILITGANRGLGFCLAQQYAEAKWRVFAGYRADGAPLAKLEQRFPGCVVALPLDVTSTASVAALAREVAALTPSLDALINNAAILPARGRGALESLKVDVGLELFDVNALGPLRVIQAVLPLLRAGKRKLIANISSEAGSIGACGRIDEHLYCMSKAALNMQSKILDNHLAPEGFDIRAIHPGWMRTEMGGPDADVAPEQAARALVGLLSVSRAGARIELVDSQGARIEW